MNAVNRAALIVIPRKPYVDWANSLDDEEPKLDPHHPEWEYTAYLIDNVENNADIAVALKSYYPKIFEHELAAWHTDEDAWPKNRDFKTFREWFKVRVSSVVLDLCDYGLEVEEFEI